MVWSVPSDNGSPITDYLVEYKLASDSSWATFNDGTSNESTATVTGLTNGASYNFRVSAINTNGSSDTSAVATATPLSATPQAPSAVSVTITGTPTVGELLVGSYTFADPNGDTEGSTSFRWLRADTVGGSYSAISGATSQNYTITSDDLNKYIKFEVTPTANNSPAIGTPVLSSATVQIDEVDYLNHILSTGQSLSTGTNGAPALSTTQPYSNLMLNGASLVNLVESGVETMSSALANTLTSLSPGGNYQSVVTRHGVGGTAYSGLKKGTGPYSTGMTQVTNVKNAATALGRVARVVGVTTIHGESDHLAGNSAAYESYLVQWQNDYETDVKAITGQSGDIPLFTDQMSSHTGYNAATSGIPIAQLSASENNPDEIILVGPKYFLNYSDSAHLTAASYRWLGEYYGKVMKKVLIDHQDWRPLSPDSIVRTGNVILANFHVPGGELAFDTTIVSAKANYGFEYYDSTSSATISSVEILDGDTVKITLSGTPTGSNQRLRYAYTGTPGSQPGASVAGSARGNLRDTDSTPSLHGNTLYNWAVHFDKAITLDTSAPIIASISSSKSDGTYSVGEVIDIDVVFSKAVSSTGNVTVTLETGATDRTCTFTVTSNTTGTCDYTVQAGDLSSDLTVRSISGTIADLDGNPMVNFTPATNLAANKALVIDTTGPIISSVVATPSTTSAVITWTTNKLASTGMTYGLTSTHTVTAPVTDTSPRVLSHSKTISSLIACTTYHYSVVSVDSSSVSTTSPNATFTTDGCVGSAEILADETTAIDASTGGTAQLTNGGNTILLNIPAGATADNLFYQIKLIDPADGLNGTGIPTGKTASNLVFDLKNIYDVNTGVAPGFDEPIEITVTYDEDDLNGIDESSLEIWHYSGGVWTSLAPCTVDTNANTVTCETDSFSVFGLFGEVAAAASGNWTGDGSHPAPVEQPHALGTNIITSDGTIYTLTRDGKRRPYTSAGAYLSYGFNTWTNVVPANNADLALEIGSFIPVRDGSIACSDRGSDKGTCYLITGGKKAGFTSSAVFKALGFSFGNAIYGDVSFMETAPNLSTSEQAHLAGTLINNSGTLQIISVGALVGIPSMQILTSWGYNPAHAVLANTFDKAYSQIQVLAERLAGVLNF
ncbi:fibronectin type III domain-containing protein [bacterium]|nr:MAG: fibronectin type III domain-containing protein [bacterium]